MVIGGGGSLGGHWVAIGWPLGGHWVVIGWSLGGHWGSLRGIVLPN